MNLQRKLQDEHKERRQRFEQSAKLRAVTTVTRAAPIAASSKVPWKIVYDCPLIYPRRPHWMEMFTPEVIRDINHNSAFQVSLRAKIVMEEVCLKHGVTRLDIVSDRRPQPLVNARHEAMFLLKQHTPWSLPQIGRYLGGKDHTSVLNGIRRHEQRMREAG